MRRQRGMTLKTKGTDKQRYEQMCMLCKLKESQHAGNTGVRQEGYERMWVINAALRFQLMATMSTLCQVSCEFNLPISVMSGPKFIHEKSIVYLFKILSIFLKEAGLLFN